MKKFWIVVVSLIAGGALSLLINRIVQPVDVEREYTSQYSSKNFADNSSPFRQVSISAEYPDFTYAAEESVKAVVFVKVVKKQEFLKAQYPI